MSLAKRQGDDGARDLQGPFNRTRGELGLSFADAYEIRAEHPADMTPGNAVSAAEFTAGKITRVFAGRRGTLHLFLSAPAGFAMMLGQLRNTWGTVQLYELDEEHNRYRPSVVCQ